MLGAGADGDLNFHASIDDGHDNPYLWHLNVAVDDVSAFDESGGPSLSVDRTTALSNGTAYTVTFEEPEQTAGGGTFPVFVDATLTWP